MAGLFLAAFALMAAAFALLGLGVLVFFVILALFGAPFFGQDSLTWWEWEWEWEWLAPFAAVGITLLAIGMVLTVALNHVVLWWTRAELRGLWGARVAGFAAVVFGAGGAVDALTAGLPRLSTLGLVWVGLVATGAAIVALSLDPETQGVFEAETGATVFEPPGTGSEDPR